MRVPLCVVITATTSLLAFIGAFIATPGVLAILLIVCLATWIYSFVPRS